MTISDATSGAVLYCTTDGTTPTTSSPKCSEPTTVYQTEFLQAIAVAPGKAASAVASAGYTIGLYAAATPAFSPAGGTYAGTQTVTISDATSGANIYYCVTAGCTPTNASPSTLYTGPVSVSQTETISAIAFASGYDQSGVATAAYTISQAVAAPAFSVPTGNYTTAQTVTISDTTTGATIYYTLDGTAPSSSSMKYTGPITVATTQVVSAIAVVGSNQSSVSVAAYTISAPAPAITSLSPSSATAGGAGFTLAVTGSNFDSTSTINWNGTALSTTYGGTTSLSASVPASLIATAGTATITVTTSVGTTNSLTFTINSSTTAPTVSGISPSSGAAGQSVTITGTNFTGATAVNFGNNNPAPNFTVNSATSITAVAPTGTGTVDITVVAPGGTSATGPADKFTYSGPSGGPSISGTVYSGTTTPVVGATVQLYAAGQTGYGSSPSTSLAASVTTDSKGAFSISYTCPAAPNDLLYVVATGGGSNNSGLSLMTALGSCNSSGFISTVTVNEVTTVASAYALQQFMTTAPNVGSSSSNYLGLSNAFATVGNLVDLGAGTARTYTPGYSTTFGSGDPDIVNNSTVPQARINTLANALNTCAADSSGCQALFTAAKPASGSTPADTLQAILDIAQNPGNSGVYAVAGGSTAFTPALAAAPNDWTLALTFTGGGLGVATNIVGTDSAGTSGVGPNIATALAIDANGNVFVAGFGEHGYPTFSTDIPILAEFNNLGAPQTPSTAVSGAATPVITFGGDNLGEAVASEYALGSVAIDTNGYIWAVDLYAGVLFTVAPNLSLLASTTSGNIIYGIAIDYQNDGWISQAGSVGEYTYSAGNSALQQQSLNGASSSQYNPGLLSLLNFDSAFNLWAYGGGAAPTLYLVTSDGAFNYSAYPTRGTASTEYISMAPDGNANVYACGDAGRKTLDVFSATAIGGASPGIVTTYALPSGGRGCGNQLLLDGAGHFFAISNGYSRIGLDYGTIDEYTIAGGVVSTISPASGYTGTSTGEQPTITNDSNTPLANSNLSYATISAAIDGSGNLWIINPDTSNSGGIGNSTGNVLVEFVGMAAPVVTPTAAAMANGELGARP